MIQLTESDWIQHTEEITGRVNLLKGREIGSKAQEGDSSPAGRGACPLMHLTHQQGKFCGRARASRRRPPWALRSKVHSSGLGGARPRAEVAAS